MSRFSGAILLAILAATPVAAQMQQAGAPLMFIRFAEPSAMQVTFYSGGAPRRFPAPVAVGLRPGYIYRFAISNLPEHPDWTLYPTVEVIGNLQLPPQLRASAYPAPIVFTQDDILHARAGAYIRKVLYLESPEGAPPVLTTADQPLETELPPGANLVEEAKIHGRPLLILRLGGKSFNERELAGEAVPGTVLLPGETALGAPIRPPYVPWACWPVFDPKLGPRVSEAECLRDGGDHGIPAGLDRDGQLRGVDPADTVAAYKDSHGQAHVAVSNPVCICVPRYAVLRSITRPIGEDVAIRLVAAQIAEKNQLLQSRTPSVVVRESVALEAVRGRERSSAIVSQEGLVNLSNSQGLTTISGKMKEQSVTGTMIEKAPVLPDRPLLLCKSADKQAAQIGEIVNFTIRYTNRGGQPISDVVVVDSLTARLEYVPTSSQADKPAIFTMQENEAGSMMLRWQINVPLGPGQSGEVKFQAKVR